MKKVVGLCVVMLALVAAPMTARADFGPWAPINPSFIGGNPFTGQFLLDKAKSTNEYQEDIGKKIEAMMNKLMKQLDEMTKEITDSIENLTLNLNINLTNIIQSGTGNSAMVMGGGGILPGFDPTWGLE
ncbi:MAG: curli assembly protein CsgF [archaeon]